MFALRKARGTLRRLALLVVSCFLWTFSLAPATRAATLRPPHPKGHLRPLTAGEMLRIVGSQYPTGTSPEPGTPYAWSGDYGTTNTCNGNKMIATTLVSWSARGGLPAAFALTHNSRSTHDAEVGQKWSHSYDIYLQYNWFSRLMTIHWGDDRAYQFTENADGSFTAPPGIHNTLIRNVLDDSYSLTTKEQVTYRFTAAYDGSPRYYCASVSEPNGNTLTITRDAGTNTLVQSVTDATSRTLTFTHDANDRITSVTDPLNRQWTLSYDAAGDLTQVTWPAVGGSTYTEQFTYSTAHNITTRKDRRGNDWTASYDTSDRISWEKDPLLNQTSYTYLTSPARVQISDPNGKVTTHEFDSTGRLVSETDALSDVESYQWDSGNNRTHLTDRRGKLWTFGYDTAGNQTSATNPLLKTVTRTFNSKHRLLTVTTPLGHQIVNTYDTTLNWNVVKVEQKAVGGTVLSTMTLTYNSDGTLATKSDSNNRQTTYGYNTHGHLNSLTTPGSRVWQWGYNTLGVPTSRTDALSRTTSYTLDNWHRQTGITYPNSTTKSFSFDANSNPTGWSDAHGTWSRIYDAANRLTSESLNGTARFTYSYDATGKKGLLSSMQDTAGRTFTYSYTDRRQLASVVESPGSLTASYTYDDAGAETGITNPNGTTVTKSYDDVGRLASVVNKNSGGVTLSSFSYGYSHDDQRTSCTEADGSAVSWTYNGAHRLTAEARTGTNPYSKTYVVDGVGNRTSQTVGTVTTTFTLNSDDELTSTSGGLSNSYQYNANGEQTSRTLGGTTHSLAWDYDGQLTSITQGSSTVSFAYDGLGRRSTRTAGGTTTQFLSSGKSIYLEAVGSTVTAYYSHGNALIRKDGEYPLFDGLGSERTVTNGSQTVTGTINYDSFGQTAGTTGSSTNPYMYAATSRYRSDGDAGLMHVGARYYDAQVGRFISRDTVLREHPYLYCEHDPANRVDPSGHGIPVLVIIAIIWGVMYITAAIMVADAGDVGTPIGDPMDPNDPRPWPNPDDDKTGAERDIDPGPPYPFGPDEGSPDEPIGKPGDPPAGWPYDPSPFL